MMVLVEMMVGVMVVLVVLVFVVVSSQLSKCAYRGGYVTKLKILPVFDAPFCLKIESCS